MTVPLPEEVRESYLEIRERQTGTVVTTLEILSPKHKRSRDGRDAYLWKRQRVLASLTHLVEIDLLRSGTPMPIQGAVQKTDYRILISRGDRRPIAQLYPFNLQESIPVFQLPLKAGDMEPLVDLNTILDGVYERAGFDLRVDYTQPPQPALSQEDATWADVLLREQHG